MTKETETLTIVSTSEPDEDGMINIVLDFHDPKLIASIEEIAKKEKKTFGQIIGDALVDMVERLGGMTPEELEKARNDVKRYN